MAQQLKRNKGKKRKGKIKFKQTAQLVLQEQTRHRIERLKLDHLLMLPLRLRLRYARKDE